MAKSNPQALIPILKEASDLFQICSKKLKVLSTISWDGKLAAEFFKKKESVLPTPTYKVDEAAVKKLMADLKELAPKLKGEHPVLQWLEKTRESYFLAARLLLSIGTPQFYEISSQLYGNSTTQLFEGQLSNLELAQSISAKLSRGILNEMSENTREKDATAFAKAIEARVKERIP